MRLKQIYNNLRNKHYITDETLLKSFSKFYANNSINPTNNFNNFNDLK